MLNADARFGRILFNRAAWGLLAALLGLSGLAWVSVSTMSMPTDSDNPLGPALLFLTTWTTMMAAMMFPSVAPVVLVYGSRARQDGDGWPLRTAAFVGGYLLTWSGIGVLAYGVTLVVPNLGQAFPILATYSTVALGAAFVLG